MCGITGWVAFARDLTCEQATLEAMTATMRERGPDAGATWLAQHAALGHRRLAVIDIEGGAQPMAADTPDGQVVLTYSGEVYNYVELRDELRRRGHAFRTASDTEVVLRAYLEWGDALVDRLNGMYAFAIWDARAERLLLVRDRLGVKPLYLYRTADGVLFGSEPKAILANPLAKRRIGLNGLRELFAYSKTVGEAVWAGMRELKPGRLAVMDRSGLRERTYWQLEAKPHEDDVEATCGRVRELLDDIVRRQLVSDVPQCVLLSGGLDSSALTGLAAQHLTPLRTFAVDFVGQTDNFTANVLQDSPDAPFVKDVAAHVGTEHTDIVLDHSTLADPAVRAAAVAARDIPIGLGDMDNSLYLLSKAVREHSTVAISGESADEVFGGYWWFHDPGIQRGKLQPWVSGPGGQQSVGRPLLRKELRDQLDIGTFLKDSYAATRAESPVLAGEDPHERRMRQISYAHLTRFLPYMLDRKDRMSMAVGLEVRVPFCDYRLVEYVFNAPWAMQTHDGREKSLLRSAVQDVIPRSVLERRKSPYPSTQELKYVMALQEQVEELLNDRSNPTFNIIDTAWAREIVSREPGSLNRVDRLFTERLLDIAAWLGSHRLELHLT
ncbi:asparagine synthase (glutamine-hydrolyzing) [Allokutzneria sp. A3M-2-11 16]|uniref:asparagine synthase (glutamine-hydrolyzing) n=1 Tax=Allokutzneria sp. A3M-2-11 16 TaxID=2962043 RepID=UPI0020B723E3|nr:asparagine synthase (glutamine-hydrolyzing) [Allokutzneria sp. A3M-2-11 16]MCP3798030.1 asparagine synthase (glutamine-hydrolyzing) [Allokutzneria sp. A3M-2-11 16]